MCDLGIPWYIFRIYPKNVTLKSVDPALIADQMKDLEGINQLMFDFFERNFGPDAPAADKECQAETYR